MLGVRPRGRRLVPTGRSAIHLGLGGALYLAGANIASGWILLIAGVVLGAVPWAAASAWRTAGRLRIHRDLPMVATAGSPTRVGLSIAGASVGSVVVRDEVIGLVGAVDGSGRLEATIRPRRGRIEAGPVTVVARDPLGLFRVRCAANVPGTCETVPPSPDLRLEPLLGSAAGGESSVRAGHGTEVVGVREHEQGDPLRHVHWKLTARHGELVVRELAGGDTTSVDVRIVGGLWSREALDTACELAAGVAVAAEGAGRAVRVHADGSSTPWGEAARRHLAGLPPHAGASPRPLADVAAPDGGINLELQPSGDGVAVRSVGGGDVGTFSDGDVGAWLTAQLVERRGD